MEAVPFLMFAAGTGIQLYGQNEANKSESAVYRLNEQLSRQEAENIRAVSKDQINQLRKEKEQYLGRQRALFAKSGVVASEGSPLELMLDTATNFEMDIATTKYNAEVAARRSEFNADYTKWVRHERKKAAGLEMATGLLKGGAGAMGFANPSSGFTMPGFASGKTSYGPMGQGYYQNTNFR